MALWAFIPLPGTSIQHVGALPQGARRLDTNEWVSDLNGDNIGRASACGFWNLDAPDAAAVQAFYVLTVDELEVLAAEAAQYLDDRQVRRNYVQFVRSRIASAKDVLADHLSDPPSPSPPAPSNVTQSLIYTYGRVQELSGVFYGGGTTDNPGVLDAIDVLFQVLLEVIERTDGIDL